MRSREVRRAHIRANRSLKFISYSHLMRCKICDGVTEANGRFQLFKGE